MNLDVLLLRCARQPCLDVRGHSDRAVCWLRGTHDWEDSAAQSKGADAGSCMQFMKDAGPPPDLISYNAALCGCGRAGQPHAAEALLREMRGRGLPPDAASYGAVLDACAKARDVPRARRVLSRMEAAGVAPNAVAYTCVLDACVRDGSEGSLAMVRAACFAV